MIGFVCFIKENKISSLTHFISCIQFLPLSQSSYQEVAKSMDMPISLQLQSIVGLLAFISFFFYLIKPLLSCYMATEVRCPPEATGSWPIVGHLPQLVGSQPPFRVLGDMADKFGPIFMIRQGVYPTLVVSSWEMEKECFTTNDKFLASRSSSAAGNHMTYDYAFLAFAFYGPYWREIRKISTLQLLSPRRLELLKHIPHTEIDIFIKGLYRIWEDTQPRNGPVKLEMGQIFGYLTLNIVLNLVVGKRVCNYGDSNHDDAEEAEGQKLYKTVTDFFKLSGVSAASDALPFLSWFDLDGQKKNMKKVAKEMDIVAEKWLQDKKSSSLLSRSSKRSNGEGEGNDFMDVLISILPDDNEKGPLFIKHSRDAVIKATALVSISLVVGASDTTSLSLTWALSLLLNEKRVLKKAQDELDTKVGRDRRVEDKDIKNLVYLQAIVKETLRMYPAVPVAPRETIKDCNIGGYKVKEGTRVLMNIWKLHRDPRVWSNPSEFRPERFLDREGEGSKMDFRGQHFEYLPFGSGRRMCPGINFASQILHMTLARLLQGFDLSSPSSSPVDMTEGSGLTLPRATPLEVLISPRLPLPLYDY
uniref:Putative cytochrome P450 n=1 Tax=Eschscholzia californica subsp. californica TaxID=222997 RepID=A0A2Z6BXS9_ESCCA|nr:putative cytochrome P450 [Eschscholzia californica subsp. californica]